MPSPTENPQPSTLRATAVLGGLGLGLLLIWLLPLLGGSERDAGSMGGGAEYAEVRGTAGDVLLPELEIEEGVVKESERPAAAPHDEMFFLRFRYEGGAVAMHRGHRVAGAVKRQRSLARKSGIYFRSVSDNGLVLADGVLPDPRVLHFSLPEGEPGSSIIRSGSMALDETEFVVRVPVLEEAASIELFSVTPEDAALSRFAGRANMLGKFPLTAIAGPPRHES